MPEDTHHRSVVVSVDFVQLHTIKPLSYTKFAYQKGDFQSICTELDAVDWVSEFNSRTMEDAVSFLYNTVYNLRNTFVTAKTVTASRKYPLWYKRPLIKLLKEKAKFHKTFKTYGNSYDRDSFIILRERARTMENDMYNVYIKKIENSIKENPRAFWSYVKSKNQSNAYPSVMEFGGRSSDRGDEVSNMFGEYFHSTFLSDTPTDVQYDTVSPQCCTTSVDIGMVEVQEEEVLKLFKSLDINKSAGPDNVPPILIIKCARSLVLPLCLLYRR